ncbi:hypothetical protein GCM10023323_64590 [Streptomyces thinghirensis]|uniref:Uncharacterized protein n=1 Tax=Streptomyces thinghirensis TaxID=551547 RepID=A0ABP9TER2_9ACTN
MGAAVAAEAETGEETDMGTVLGVSRRGTRRTQKWRERREVMRIQQDGRHTQPA